MPDILLLPLTPDVGSALEDEATFEATTGVLLDGAGPLARMMVQQSERHRESTGADPSWGGFLVSDRRTRKLIGTCAFTGEPDARGRVEIAYFTFPAHEGQGYGTAMARALCAEGAARPEVRTLTALTLPESSGSTRILKKVGFVRHGTATDHEAGEVWLWEKRVAPLSAGEDIAQRVRKSIDGPVWHGPPLMELVTRFTTADAIARPIPSANTAAELVVHVALWAMVALARLETVQDRQQDSSLEDGWYRPAVDDETWAETVAFMRTAHAELAARTETLDDEFLARKLPGREDTAAEMLNGVVEHAAYHGGQLAILARALGILELPSSVLDAPLAPNAGPPQSQSRWC